MKTFFYTLLSLLCSMSHYGQPPKWSFEKSHCRIGFSVTHFGISETEGQFRKFDGTISTTKPDFSDAKFTFSAEVNSIDTDDAQRDAHLKSADFFDAAQYPTLVFVSKSFKKTGKNKYSLVGELTMHGITKTITLSAVYGGTIQNDPFGNTKAGFKFFGTLNRKDWGLTWNKALDAGGLAIGNEVRITCNVEFLKEK